MIVYGLDDYICEWVSKGLGGKSNFFKDAVALGVLENNQLCAGIVYNNYQTDKYDNPLSIEMTIYSVDKIWCKRHNLRQLFCYPFAQLMLRRVQATCSAQDEGVIMFLKRLGFQQEGVHRQAYIDGSDAISFSMLRNECKWSK